MNQPTRILLWSLVFLGAGGPLQAATSNGAPDHQTYARVLREFVRDARVDYAGLKARPGDLDAYLEELARVAPAEFARWPRGERLALLINLYNAQTLRLIVDHHPIAGIRKIGLLPGSAWKRKVVRFGGRVTTLDDLEHGVIRREYQEPRIHFALVCAAKGCPPLRDEPYLPERLEDQLNDQARRFLAEAAKNRVDSSTRTLWLSPIFEWFEGDFTAGGTTIVEYVERYLPEAARRELRAIPDLRVRYSDYDWSLNEQAKP
ncbi:MAG: DUF547 domain-containing protein [Limisphaerales bacterium]